MNTARSRAALAALAVVTASVLATIVNDAGSSAGALEVSPVAGVDADLISADVTGTFFVDFDRDGRVDPGETPSDLVAGHQVTVSTRDRLERGRTDADGNFSIPVRNVVAPDGIETGVRVEVDVPEGFHASFGTARVQHARIVDGERETLRFGVVPESRCPDDPATVGDPSGSFPDGHPNSFTGKLWSACFVAGPIANPAGAQDVLVAATPDLDEWQPAAGTEFGGHQDVEHLATKQQMGAIWGVAHDEWDGVLFASAVVKRHSALGPEGIDGLYWRSSSVGPDGPPEVRSVGLDDVSPPGAPSFGDDPPDCPRRADGGYDLESWTFEATALGAEWDCRDLDGYATGEAATESFDWWAFDRVGRSGIGDIDTTPDGERLLVLNATADAVFVYDVGAIGPDVEATATPIYLDHHPVSMERCDGGAVEAWGLRAIDASAAYVGATCTAEVSGDVDDLVSEVLRLDLATGRLTTVVTVSHDHPHGAGYVEAVGPNGGRFQPWSVADEAGRPTLPPMEDAVSIAFLDFLDAWGYSNAFDWHQPLLSDIEIDPADGSLTLAVMDRWSMMTGVFNCDLDPTVGGCGYEFPAPPIGDYDDVPGDDEVAGYTSGIIAYVAGDLLRACNVGARVETPEFVLEGADGCDPSTHSPAFEEPYGGGPAGPYEWYWNDQAFAGLDAENPHPEASMGAVSQPPRASDVVYTAMNPTETFGAGLSRDRHDDGAHVAGIQFFRTDFRDGDGTFWKSAGLGDVEGCSVPMEIGDHVWFDESADGVRDPDEPPIAGVVFRLIDPATEEVVATTASDRVGRWAFGTSDGLAPGTEYLIRVESGADVVVGGLEGSDLVPTVFRVLDADVALDSDLPSPGESGQPFQLRVRTGEAGATDHSIDVGLTSLDALGVQVAEPEDERAGPPWRTLGVVFAGLAVFGVAAIVILRRFVW